MDDLRPEPIKNTAPVFRVFHVTDQLREAIHSCRAETSNTIREWVHQAVAVELPGLVERILAMLPDDTGEGRRPMRLPMAEDQLSDLRAAANRTGLPATRLLLACLILSGKQPPPARKGGRRKKAAVAEESPAVAPPTDVEPAGGRGRDDRKKRPPVPAVLPEAPPTEPIQEEVKSGRGRSGRRKRSTVSDYFGESSSPINPAEGKVEPGCGGRKRKTKAAAEAEIGEIPSGEPGVVKETNEGDEGAAESGSS